jgi:hypothetical protein
MLPVVYVQVTHTVDEFAYPAGCRRAALRAVAHGRRVEGLVALWALWAAGADAIKVRGGLGLLVREEGRAAPTLAASPQALGQSRCNQTAHPVSPRTSRR